MNYSHSGGLRNFWSENAVWPCGLPIRLLPPHTMRRYSGQPVADTFPPSRSRRAGFSATSELLVNTELNFEGFLKTVMNHGTAAKKSCGPLQYSLWCCMCCVCVCVRACVRACAYVVCVYVANAATSIRLATSSVRSVQGWGRSRLRRHC